MLEPSDWDAWEQGLQGDSQVPDDSGTGPDDTGPGDSDTDDTGPIDTGEHEPQPELHGLSPAFGPRGGGSPVTLQGVQLSSDATVLFGGVEASVGVVSDSALELTTPAVSSAAWVDVTVEQAGGQALLEDGFRYLDLDDASGLIGAMGALQWFDHRGSYWAPNIDDYGLMQLWFPGQPDTTHYRDLFAAELDACASDHFDVDSSGGLDLEGASAVVTSTGGGELAPVWSGTDRRFEMHIGPGELEESASFDLALSGLWDLPDFTIADLAATPAPFLLTSPAIDGGAPLTLGREQLTFLWQAVEADAVVIYISRLTGDGRETLEIMSCLAENDGAFTIPTGAWDGWQTGNQLITYVGALRESDTTVPLNNGGSSVVGISWNVGVILTR